MCIRPRVRTSLGVVGVVSVVGPSVGVIVVVVVIQISYISSNRISIQQYMLC